ncbi:glutathione S-transferase [Acrasis kona]|uniref:Glutathione S-transferase n=1 Tax=Acrasis kona TaxID=1008807 RepID=A0AAW2YPE5_9EUKA
MTLKLWWGSGSPYSWRIQLFLHEKNIEFESKQVQFSKKETRTDEFLKMNPRGKIPVLQDGDIIMYESMAIIAYLEEKYGPLGPSIKNPNERAKVLTRTYEAENYLLVQGYDFLRYIYGFKQDKEAAIKNYDALIEEMSKWEKYLETAKFFAGEDLTLVDCLVVPFLYAAERSGFDYKAHGFSKISQYVEENRNRSSFVASSPPHYKETPGTNKVADFVQELKKERQQ